MSALGIEIFQFFSFDANVTYAQKINMKYSVGLIGMAVDFAFGIVVHNAGNLLLQVYVYLSESLFSVCL